MAQEKFSQPLEISQLICLRRLACPYQIAQGFVRDLTENSTFQEHEEAVAKLRRVKLSSTQLPTYCVGWCDWLRVRKLDKQTQGGSFQLADFHDRALKEGTGALPVLAWLLTGKGFR
jgi:uncharacterized protein (DUF885 family)